MTVQIAIQTEAKDEKDHYIYESEVCVSVDDSETMLAYLREFLESANKHPRASITFYKCDVHV